MASIVIIIRISSSFDRWWKAEDMKDIVTCRAFHMPCRPDSCTLITVVLLFCRSWGVLVCSSRMELSHGTDGLQNMLVILACFGNGLGIGWACKAHERCDMSQYLLHNLSLSSLIKAGRYFYYIHNWSQMLMLLRKKFWISSSFPHWYCPWIIYCFISDLFSIYFVNK